MHTTINKPKLLIVATVGFSLLSVSASSNFSLAKRDRRELKVQNLFQDPDVFLTVSSEAAFEDIGNETKLYDRHFELNWYNFDDVSPTGDFVGLYQNDPTLVSDLIGHASEIISVNSSTGYYKTAVKYVRDSNLTTSSNHCRGYWIAFVRSLNDSRHVVQSRCFTIYPTWMNDLKGTLGNRSLSSIMIPGAHDAGSWKEYDGRPSENIILNYVMCQEETIYHQLVHGIRYLDIRVAYYPLTAEKFWINHGAFRVRPLLEVISDVIKFVSETKEIIIFDFHEFPVGFTNQTIHDMLADYIKTTMGPFLVSKSLTQSATLNQIWETGATVILGYADETTVNKNDFLWKNVEHAWGDTTSESALFEYLDDTTYRNGCTGKYWSAMAEYTPTAEDILLRPNFGLRGFANLINHKLAYWYHDQSWYSRTMVVATDYHLGNDIINVAYTVNKNLAVCS